MYKEREIQITTMTPIQRAKGQHYLPKLYLRRFAIPGGKKEPSIWAYNKTNDIVESMSITNVCKESGFHDVIDGEGNAKTLEPDITENENRLGKAYNAFCDDPTPDKLWSHFADIATYIAFLMARSRRYRRILNTFATQVNEVLEGAALPTLWPGFNENDIKINHLNLISEETNKIVQQLGRMEWVICINRTPRLFYTSDYPFAYGPITEEGGQGRELAIPSVSWLLEREGMSLYFPVTPRVALIIGDATTHSHIPHTIYLDTSDVRTLETVRTLNRAQVVRSERFVFSQKDDFALVRETLREDVSLRNPDRNYLRVGIVHKATVPADE